MTCPPQQPQQSSSESSDDELEDVRPVARPFISNPACQLQRVAQTRRPGIIYCPPATRSPALKKGMRELDNFGFRTAESQVDPTGFLFLTERHKRTIGFHVSDLWSQRQQQEFLKRLRLEKAQYARERHVAFLNFLIQNRKKLVKPVDADLLYQRIAHDVNPELAAKYSNAGNKGALLRQIANQMTLRCRSELSLVGSLTPRVGAQSDRPSITDRSFRTTMRLNLVEGLIGHCRSTLKEFHREGHNLAQATRGVPEEKDLRKLEMEESARTMLAKGMQTFSPKGHKSPRMF